MRGRKWAVLLKNDGLLPLEKGGTLAVIGPNAKAAQIMGGGSAQLNPHYMVSPWDGLLAKLGENALTYAAGCTNTLFEPLLNGPIEVDYFKGRAFEGPVAGHQSLESGTTFWIPPIGGSAVDPADFSARKRAKFTPDNAGLRSRFRRSSP